MYLPAHLSVVPGSMLLLLTAATFSSAQADNSSAFVSQQPQWPYNLPPHMKYWPEDPPHQRRDLDFLLGRIQSGEVPTVVKKMSGDESEMFFHDYWGLQSIGSPPSQVNLGEMNDESEERRSLRRGYEHDEDALLANSSAILETRPAYALHFQDSPVSGATIRERRQPKPNQNIPDIFKRGSCPTGTNDCSSIGYANSCCATGETCIQITDTGLGPVGCCPTGSTCAGTITSCSSGQTACAQQLGGGCCIAGYQCSGVGCVQLIIVTITSVFTVSSTPTTTLLTTTMTSTAPTTTATDTSPQTTLTCASNARACPINLGGGCCPTDRICTTGLLCPLSPGASSTSITTIIVTSTSSATVTASTPSDTSSVTTTTETPAAPVRPTSSDETITTTTTPSTCPTGFYQCSAYYAGGACCRVGRDCATTNCPSTSSTTLVSDGVTVIVPLTGSATSFATSAGGSVCATGWSSCGGGTADTAGGCCPTGYGCGAGSCTATASASGTGTVGKGSLGSGGGRVRVGWGVVGGGIGLVGLVIGVIG